MNKSLNSYEYEHTGSYCLPSLSHHFTAHARNIQLQHEHKAPDADAIRL